MVGVRREFDSRSQIHSGVVQWAERGLRNAVTGVRFSAPDPRAWSSGRASAFQADDVSSTLTVRSNLRAWPIGWASDCQSDQASSILAARSKFRGASSMGEPWSCKPQIRVRFPGIPPSVAVAESGFRRLAVNQSYVGSNPTGHPR